MLESVTEAFCCTSQSEIITHLPWSVFNLCFVLSAESFSEHLMKFYVQVHELSVICLLENPSWYQHGQSSVTCMAWVFPLQHQVNGLTAERRDAARTQAVAD